MLTVWLILVISSRHSLAIHVSGPMHEHLNYDSEHGISQAPETPEILERLKVNLGAELKHPPGRIGVVRRDTAERAGRVVVLPCGNVL
jgi:hypothetical protein